MCCRNPDNVHCVGTIFPNLNVVFASICAPVRRSIFNPTNTEVAQLSNNDALSRGHSSRWRTTKNRQNSEFAKCHDSYTPEECADEWRQNNVDLKLLENCAMNGFIMFGIMFITATGLDTVIWRLNCFTVSFRGDVRGESGTRELVSVNWRTPQWARGQFTRNIIPDWFEKWRDIKFWYMCYVVP